MKLLLIVPHFRKPPLDGLNLVVWSILPALMRNGGVAVVGHLGNEEEIDAMQAAFGKNLECLCLRGATAAEFFRNVPLIKRLRSHLSPRPVTREGLDPALAGWLERTAVQKQADRIMVFGHEMAGVVGLFAKPTI